MDDRDPFAIRLHEARLAANLTQVQVEETTGIAQSSLSLYEMGQRRPDDVRLKKLAVAYGLDEAALTDLLRLRMEVATAQASEK